MTEKDRILKEILERNSTDLLREEDSNLAVYVMRKG